MRPGPAELRIVAQASRERHVHTSVGQSGAVRRILIVDDNSAIHRDFQKVLCSVPPDDGLSKLEHDLFGSRTTKPPTRDGGYQVSFASSGEAALNLVRRASVTGQPFMMAFVDMRMPGWDGIETILQLWQVQPQLEVAICSAYMDYSWHDVIKRLGRPGLRLLQKPWASGEVLAVAQELCSRALARLAESAGPMTRR
jgi:CheY-like chemotaxis protein